MPSDKHTVLICRGTGCESAKAPVIQAELDAGLADSNIEVKYTGCHGMCQQGPIVIVEPHGTFYANVKPDDAGAIVDSLATEGGTGRETFLQRPCHERRAAYLSRH